MTPENEDEVVTLPEARVLRASVLAWPRRSAICRAIVFVVAVSIGWNVFQLVAMALRARAAVADLRHQVDDLQQDVRVLEQEIEVISPRPRPPSEKLP